MRLEVELVVDLDEDKLEERAHLLDHLERSVAQWGTIRRLIADVAS